MKSRIFRESFPLQGAFRIARGARTEAQVLRVEWHQEGVCGQGECLPYVRYGESFESVIAQIESASSPSALPPGAARNALDCAQWDWRAKSAGKRVWELLDRPAPTPAVTAYTLSLDTPEAMARSARTHAQRPVLKVKLGADDDLACLRAVRSGAPRSTLIIDANEAWDIAQYRAMVPALVELGVALIEQPLPADDDAMLLHEARPIALCADESCHTSDDLERLQGCYDYVNIKLDKTGGLSEALALHTQAQAQGFGLMIGCMMASSLSMAPATLLCEGAQYVDLDGPLWMAQDRSPALHYDNQYCVHPPHAELWG